MTNDCIQNVVTLTRVKASNDLMPKCHNKNLGTQID